MKKLFVLCMLISCSINYVFGQSSEIAEPDTASANLMYYIDSSNQLKPLLLETGEIKEHKNKLGSIASIAGNIADAAGAIGGIGTIIGAHTGSLSTVLGSLEVMGAAGSIVDLASIADNLAGAEGHDLTFSGATSKTAITPTGKDIKFLVNIKCKDKATALSVFKIVKFKTSKKDRRLRWLQTKAALINTEKSSEANKAGYLSFGYMNYGQHSSLLSIPVSELSKGEYGIYFLGNMFAPNLAVTCYTFSIK